MRAFTVLVQCPKGVPMHMRPVVDSGTGDTVVQLDDTQHAAVASSNRAVNARDRLMDLLGAGRQGEASTLLTCS